ncbi:MAG: hypothetical protein IJB96_07010 [Lachnospira sp.]|nr:hypothetical protein [Lachnospira sp.]
MTNKLLTAIKNKYPVTELDIGDMKTLKANGMTFTINAYNAEGLGHVSVMRAKGFFGLMKMDTLIINPLNVDLPLYSYDRIFAMGNDTLIVELYDTLVGDYSAKAMADVKNRYKDLPERDPGEHWYDNIKLPESISTKGKKAHTPRFDELTVAHFDAYIKSPASVVTDMAAKQAKASYYVNGLLTNGGPSTDVFKKALGYDKTEKLFKQVLFGV